MRHTDENGIDLPGSDDAWVPPHLRPPEHLDPYWAESHDVVQRDGSRITVWADSRDPDLEMEHHGYARCAYCGSWSEIVSDEPDAHCAECAVDVGEIEEAWPDEAA